MNALWLTVGGGIRAVGFAIPLVEVKRAGVDVGDGGAPVTPFIAGHGNEPVFGSDEVDRRLFQQGRPQGKGAGAVAVINSAKGQ